MIADRALGPEDPDQLQHLPIAERTADLIAAVDTPVNVALFGAWGSGKSSFAQLLRGCLRKRKPTVGMVIYDAWTFEGESFQRNFISAAATGLGLQEADEENREFHGGLYEGRHSARLRLSPWDLLKLLGLATGIAAIALVFLTALVAGLARVLGEDPIQSVARVLPSLIPATAVAGLLGSITREILAGARVDIDESAPTQEQFRTTFGQLVRRAQRKGKFERLVFFVDELDRCSPEQVVQVLAAVRHFYNLPDCVFVIAADREVIELAIQRKSQQATPVNKESPYYSSASEYIDKVFQFQVALPPLRSRRLTRFARELVATRTEGLWHEVGEGDPNRRDLLMYVLIPSHVRSPRRVKVLLNNFATNARVAEARGLDWLDRAYEIAKLTVLRTEFPTFAADLHLEPRLPRLLLNPPDDPSPRLKEFLDRHYLPLTPKRQTSLSSPAEVEPVMTAPDPIVARGTSDDRADMTNAGRINLRRYLMRTSSYADPGRDLLFLEPAGAAVDLNDETFGELIEADAIETPETVVAAAAEQNAEERRKAVRVLADMITQEFGQERANLTTALLDIAGLLDYDVSPYEEDVLGALQLFQNEEGLEQTHLAGALAIAAKHDGDDGFVDELMTDERLLVDAEQVEQIAMIAPALSQVQVNAIWDKVAEFYPTAPKMLDGPLTHLPSSTAGSLIAHPALRTAMQTYISGLDPDGAEATVDELFGAIANRATLAEELSGRLLWTLVAGGPGPCYDQARANVERLNAFKTAISYRNGLALFAVEKAPPADWQAWTEQLQPTKSGRWANESELARDAAASIVQRWPSVGDSADDAVIALDRITQHIDRREDGDAAAQVAPLISLGGTAWWASEATTSAQHAAYRALLTFGGIGAKSHRAVSAPIVEDIERALMSGIVGENLHLARSVATLVDKDGLEYLAAVLEGLPSPAPPLDVEVIETRLAVASAGKAIGADPQGGSFAVSAGDVETLVAAPNRQVNLERWYGLNPPYAAGLAVALAVGPAARGGDRNAVAGWATSLTSAERTAILLEMLKLADDISAWVVSIQVGSLEEGTLESEIAARMRSVNQGPRREDLARSLAAYRPADPRAQGTVAGIILWLLSQDKKVDFNAAVIALGALGPNHSAGGRLANAFESAQKQGRSLPRRARDDIERAKVPIRKRKFPDLFGAFRRGK